jgi:hypothetical protein
MSDGRRIDTCKQRMVIPMRRRYPLHSFLLLLFLSIGMLDASGQSGGTLSSAPSTLDFGSVPVGAVSVIRILTISRSAKDTLPWITIDSVLLVHGTAFALVGARPQRVDSSVFVGLRFRPTVRQDETDSLLIYYGQQLKKVLAVKIQGKGGAPTFSFRNSRDSLLSGIDFGSILVRDTADTTVVLRNGDSSTTMKIDSIGIVGDRNGTFSISGGPAPGTVIGNGVKPGMTLSYHPMLPLSDSAYILVGYSAAATGYSGTATLWLRGRGSLPEIDSIGFPSPISFGTLRADSCSSRPESLKNNNTHTVRIDTIEITGPGAGHFTLRGIKSGALLQGGASIGFAIDYCPDGTDCDSASLHIVIGTSSRDIPITGCSKEPIIGILPASLDFGMVDTDTPHDSSFIISNSGNMPLVVMRLALDSGTSFHITDSLLFTVPAGRSRSVGVQFYPRSDGSFTDRISISSDASNANVPKVITLSGSARTPAPQRLWMAPDSIELAGVWVGTTRDTTIDLRNIGAASLDVKGAQLEHPFGDVGFTIGLTVATTVLRDSTLVLPIRFTPRDTGTVEDIIAINKPGDSSFLRIRVRGRGIRLVTDMDTVIFGDILVGDSSTITFNVLNRETVPGTLPPGTIVGTDGGAPSNAFSILSPLSSTSITAGGSQRIIIRYKPSMPGPDSALWRVRFDAGGSIQVRLSATASGSYRVWLDTAQGKAGDSVHLTMHISPPLNRTQGITRYSARLRIDTMALLPIGVRDGVSGTGFGVGFDPLRRIIVDRPPANPALDGSTLFTIYFKGLSTGSFQNIVRIDSFRIEQLADAPDTLDYGIIYLAGCDIARTLPLARRSKLGALKVAPGSREAVLTFTAASGSHPRVRIVDLSGEEVLESDLPEGTGDEQTVSIGLDRLPPGLMFLELRVESDRSTIPIMLMR